MRYKVTCKSSNKATKLDCVATVELPSQTDANKIAPHRWIRLITGGAVVATQSAMRRAKLAGEDVQIAADKTLKHVLFGSVAKLSRKALGIWTDAIASATIAGTVKATDAFSILKDLQAEDETVRSKAMLKAAELGVVVENGEEEADETE